MQLVSYSPHTLAFTFVLTYITLAVQEKVAFARLSHFPSLLFSPPSTVHILRTMLCLTHVLTYVDAHIRTAHIVLYPLECFYIDWHCFWKSNLFPRRSFMPRGRRGREIRPGCARRSYCPRNGCKIWPALVEDSPEKSTEGHHDASRALNQTVGYSYRSNQYTIMSVEPHRVS